MKRLFRKDNRIARIIALCLVAIMVLTPLYQHSGFKMPVKAADSGVFPSEIPYGVPLDLSNIEIVKNEETGIYELTSMELPAEEDIPKIHAYYDGDDANAPTYILSVQPSNGLKYNMVVDDTETTYSMTSGYKVVGTVISNYSDIALTSAVAPTVAPNVLFDQYYAIFVSIDDGCSNGTDVSLDGGQTSDEYKLQAVYKLIKDESLTNNWRAADGTALTPDGTYKEAYVGVPQKAGDLYIGTVEYWYTSWNNSDTVGVNNYNNETQISQGKLDKTSGDYVVWAKYYCPGNAEGKWYSILGKRISIDTIAPSLNGNPYLKDSNSNTITCDSNKLFYLDKGETYNLEFRINENVHNVDRFKVKATAEDGTVVELPDAIVNNPAIGYHYIMSDFAGELAENTTYTLTVDVSDDLGNTATLDLGKSIVIDKSFKVTYKVVRIETDGTVTEVGTSFDDLGSNRPHKLITTVSSGDPIEKAVLNISGSKEETLTIGEGDFVCSGGLYKKTLEYTFDQPGQYWIHSTVIEKNNGDKAENVYLGNFTYETVAPYMNWVGIYKKKSDNNWENVTDQIDSGIFSLDNDNATYKLVFEAQDPPQDPWHNNYFKSDLSGGKLFLGDTEVGTLTKSTTNVANNITGGFTEYTIDLDRAIIAGLIETSGGPVKFTGTIYDKATNNKSADTPNFAKAITGMGDVSATLTTGENGNTPVDLANPDDSNRISQNPYILNIKVTSDAKISDIVIGEENSSATYEYSKEVVTDNAFNGKTKRYTYEANLTLPKDTNVNELISSGVVTVTDEKQDAKSANIGGLLYDSTKPVIVNDNNSEDGTFSILDETWYNADTVPTIKATITPGPQATKESGINPDSVSYTFSNSVADDCTNQVTVVSPSSVAINILGDEIPESKNGYGTKITFNATDKAYNSLEENNTTSIRVDRTEPWVNAIKLNSNEAYKKENQTQLTGIVVGPQLKIQAEVADNLSLDSAKVQLLNDEGVVVATYEKTHSFGDDAINGNSTEIKSTTPEHAFEFANVPDGSYVIKITVTDKAGNEATITTNEFTVGSKLTVNTAIIKKDGESYTNVGENFGEEGTISNKVHSVDVNITSGYSISELVLYKTIDGNTEEFTHNLTNSQYKDGDYYKVRLNIPLVQEGTDVVYESIKIKVSDQSGRAPEEIDLYSYTYDSNSPNVEYKAAYMSSDNGATWTKLESYHMDWQKREYYIDPTKLSHLYRFVYTVEENCSGVNEAVLVYDNSSYTRPLTENTGTPITDSEKTEYYAQLSGADIVSDIGDFGWEDKLRYKAKVTDAATNDSGVTEVDFIIVKPESDFDLTAVLYRENADGTRTAVDLSTDDYYTNQPYVLHAWVSSLYELDNVTLTYGDDNAVLKKIQISEEQNEEGRDDTYKRYSVEVDIYVPQNLVDENGQPINQIINNMKLSAWNSALESVEVGVGSLLYDATLPIFINADREDGKLVDDQTWYASYSFDALITPGPQGENAIESQIANASYSITGSVDDKSNETLQIEDGKVKVDFSVPASTTLAGTRVEFSASDEAGNILESNNVAVIRVDAEKPIVEAVKVCDDKGYETLVGKNVTIDMIASDNLGFNSLKVQVNQLTGGTATFTREFDHTKDVLSETNTEDVTIGDIYTLPELADGTYEVIVTAYDKADTPSDVIRKTFEVDEKAPTNKAKIISGTVGGKNPMKNHDGSDRDYYYKSDVVVELEYTEKNLGSVVVKDNDKEVKGLTWNKVDGTDTYVTSYTAKGEGTHNITISTSDKTGHNSTPYTITFAKDTTPADIQVVMNSSLIYDESMGQQLFINNTTLGFTEKEEYKDPNGFYYKLTKTVPAQAPIEGKYIVTSERNFTYTEEAEYEVQVYSVDMANHTSRTRTARFKIDKTAPVINIGGIASGGTSATPVNLSFNIQELFFDDVTGEVRIYADSDQGPGERLIDTITYDPNATSYSITRQITESGVYRVEFEAQDGAHPMVTTEITFTIDTEAPVVSLEGVSNFDVTDQDVTISSIINDKFYSSKKVTITGTRTDETGKVSPITVEDYNPAANPTIINKTFTEDGIYDITITCVDIAGNSDSKSAHFIIDKSEPVIGDLSHIDGKVLSSFEWNEDIEELVSDLTVCDVHMYLNGQEYDGKEAVEDGAYVLLITAEDELGHKVEKSVQFVLDTKAPVFIVTGVEKDEKKLEPYNITVSLQLDEDKLTSVTLNGKVITITNNTATIEVVDVGEYELRMEAVDEAGNVSSDKYEFELKSEKEFNYWIIVAILALLAITIIIIILKKKKNRD